MLTLSLRKNTIADDLDRLVAGITNPSRAHTKNIADAIRAGFQDNFESEGAAGAGQWAALAPMTVRQRQARGFGGAHPILVQTGKYKNSFIRQGATDHIERVRSGGGGVVIEVGSSDDRGEKLEFGTGRIPARPVVPLGAGSEARIMDVIENMLNSLPAKI